MTMLARVLILATCSLTLCGCVSTMAIEHRVSNKELRTLDSAERAALRADEQKDMQAAKAARKQAIAVRVDADRARDAARATMELKKYELSVAKAAVHLAQMDADRAARAADVADAVLLTEQARHELKRYIALSNRKNAKGEAHAKRLAAFSVQLKDAEHFLTQRREQLARASQRVERAQEALQAVQTEGP